GALAQLVAGVLPAERVWPTFLIWWMGDATGVLLAAPPLLAAHNLRRRDWVAAAGSAAVLIAVSTLSFGPVFGNDPRRLVFSFIPLVYLVWAAVKFGGWVGSVNVLLVAVVTVAWRSSHPGPIDQFGRPVAQLIIWGYLLSLAFLVLLVNALLAERN